MLGEEPFASAARRGLFTSLLLPPRQVHDRQAQQVEQPQPIRLATHPSLSTARALSIPAYSSKDLGPSPVPARAGLSHNRNRSPSSSESQQNRPRDSSALLARRSHCVSRPSPKSMPLADFLKRYTTDASDSESDSSSETARELVMMGRGIDRAVMRGT